MIWAAVPVKDLVNAKQRLRRILSPPERRELARMMVSDVLRALTAARLGRVWVVTRDREVAALARGVAAEVLREPENRGHTSAVAFAQAQATRAGADVFVTVPGDVPCTTAEEVCALADAAAVGRVAAFAPSRSGHGTNGVALAPPDALALRFGEPSFENHLAAARSRGLTLRVLMLRGLSLDIDDRDDLSVLLREGTDTESGRLLARWGIAERVLAARAAVVP